MDNDDLFPDFDPYDMLQEHNLLINRLIKTNQKQEQLIGSLLEANQYATENIVSVNKKLFNLEKKINLLNQYKQGPSI